VELMTKSEVLQFHNGSATESAGERRDNGTHMFKHAENTMAANPKDKLHEAVIVYWQSGNPAKKELPMFGSRLLLDLKLVLEEVRSRLKRLERARQ
jgi:hypothetical protein